MNRAAVTTVDSFLSNCYLEMSSDGRNVIVKWPGMTSAYTYNGGGASNGQGMAYYNNSLYAMGSNVLYRLTGGTIATSSPLTTFTQGSNVAYSSRNAYATAVFNNKIFVLGGFGSVAYNDVWSSPDGVNWTQVLSAAPWAARGYFQAVVFNNLLFIMGGLGAGAANLNDVWSTPDGVIWTRVTAAAQWSVRASFGAVVMNNGIFVMGGGTSDGSNVVKNDVWFSIDGATWVQQVLVATWGARSLFGCVVLSNKIFVIGGYNSTGPAAYNDVYSSPDGITWTQTAAAAFATARYQQSCTVYTNKLVALGGRNIAGTAYSDVYTSPDGITWTLVTNTPGWIGTFYNCALVFQLPSSVSTTRQASLWLIGRGQSVETWYGALSVNIAASFSPATSATTSEQWQFTTVNNNQYMVAKNSVDAWYLYSGLLTKITSTNYPKSTVPGVVSLDSTVYVMGSDGTIYGCNLQDPTTWNSMNFITADYESDAGVRLCKLQNYICALKKNTTQFFYDAGNPTGSPLSPILNATANIGCASAGSVVQMDNTLVYMSQTFQMGRSIVVLNGFSPVKISNQYVDRILNADDLATVYAFSIKVGGHDFYVLTLKTSAITLVCDMATKEWHVRKSGTTYFRGINYATDNATDFIQDELLGIVYSVSPTLYQDNAATMTVTAIGDKVDLNSNQRKFCARLDLIGDRYSSTNNVTISWTDDDYQTYSTGVVVDMSTSRPGIPRMGSFRRRAHKITHTDNMPLRLEAFELTVLPGDT